jgi:hypothetical protein
MDFILTPFFFIPLVITIICLFSPSPIKITIAFVDLGWIFFLYLVTHHLSPEPFRGNLQDYLMFFINAMPLLAVVIYYIRKLFL